jgi:serine/threonine protein kinase
MEQVQLDRFKLEGELGSGADYEAHAAIDTQTGRQVVIKRPNPDYISRKMHGSVEQLSEQLIEVHRAVGASAPHLAHMIGYTEPAQHDAYFGDSLKESYRVLVEERAKGLPLLSDVRDRFKGVPIGLPQNLFALHPLVSPAGRSAFTIHRQLLDVEEAFHNRGHLLLDMRPENVYFDPMEGEITVIDIGATPTQGPAAQGRINRGNQPPDMHNFFSEVFSFYATPDLPPSDVNGYRNPPGMRVIPDFNQQINSMVQSFSGIKDLRVKEAAVTILQKVRDRGYSSFGGFRSDLDEYLALLEERNAGLPDLDNLVGVWGQAVGLLTEGYWQKFLFGPSDLAAYTTT